MLMACGPPGWCIVMQHGLTPTFTAIDQANAQHITVSKYLVSQNGVIVPYKIEL